MVRLLNKSLALWTLEWKICNWLIREFDQVVLLWNQRIDSTEKKKPNKDDQLITSVNIHVNLLITQESSNTNPTSNSKINKQKSISNCNSRADPGHPTHIHGNPNRIHNLGIQDRPYQGHLKSQPMTTAWWQYEIKFLDHRMTFRICYNNQSWPKSHFHRSWEKSNNYKSILQSWKILKKQCYSLYLGIVPWDLVQKQSLSSRTISGIKEKCIYTRPQTRIRRGSC